MSQVVDEEQTPINQNILVPNSTTNLQSSITYFQKNIFSFLMWSLVISLIISLIIVNIFTYKYFVKQNTILTQKLQSLEQLQKESQNNLLQAQIDLISSQQREAKNYAEIISKMNKINEVKVDEKESRGGLPLVLPFLNQQNQGYFISQQRIEEVLYNQETQKKRLEFYIQRVKFINSRKEFPSLALAKYNLILTADHKKTAKVDFDIEWQRIQEKFQLSKITEELPMCLIVPGYNNNANFRIQTNLNSIFTQNYSNYKVIIINDASTDGSGDTYRRYFEFYGIDPAHYTYIENQIRVTAVENIYIASTQHCGKDQIVVTIDADDEFIGRNALKIFNWGYQTKKVGVLYSNFYFYRQSVEVSEGFTQQHTEEQKNNNLYRDVKMKFSHLRSYRNELFLKLDPRDLKDESGQFYKIMYDQAIFFPLMQMSCGRVQKIEGQYNLLYTMGTGLNDYSRKDDLGAQTQKRIRTGKKYECVKQFDQKMKSLS